MSQRALGETEMFHCWMRYASQRMNLDPRVMNVAITSDVKAYIRHETLRAYEEYVRRHPGTSVGIDDGNQEIDFYAIEDVRPEVRFQDGTVFLDAKPVPMASVRYTMRNRGLAGGTVH